MYASRCLFLFLSIVFAVAQPEVKHVATTHRFLPNIYDYYFYCSSRCTGLHWTVNDNAALLHIIVSSHLEVGYATYEANPELICASIILENNPASNGMSHLGVLLLLQYSTLQEDLNVTCVCENGTPEEATVSINQSLNCPEAVNNRSDTIDLIISKDGLIAEYSTFVFVCQANQSLSWIVRGEVVGKYNLSDTPAAERGADNVQTQRNSEIVYTKTLLLNHPPIALLILNYNNTEITDSVTCRSDGENFNNTEQVAKPCPTPETLTDGMSTTELPGDQDTSSTTANVRSSDIKTFPSISFYFIMLLIIIIHNFMCAM